MSLVEWILVVMLVAALMILLMLMSAAHRAQVAQWQRHMAKRPAPRLHEQCRSTLLAEPMKISGSVDISTFIGADGLTYISAADTQRLGEQASEARQPRHVKVYRKQPGDTYEDRNKVYYGQNFSAAIFHHIELVDPPMGKADQQWIREHLMTRITPGGKLRLSKDMVPHG